MKKKTTKKKQDNICPIVTEDIKSISMYFEILDSLLKAEKDAFWFRGHADQSWELKPSALRYPTIEKRELALKIQSDFKRLVYNKLNSAPPLSDKVSWMGLAQHYGIPTRFLDWTRNPAIALYFAINGHTDKTACVYLLNAEELNKKAFATDRIFSADEDISFFEKYLELDGKENSRGKKKTIAINPIYNSERILLQRGAFTLHGNKKFSLDSSQASSLVCINIKPENKSKLRTELRRIGIDQMSIFPEPEHVSKYLKNFNDLNDYN